MARTLGFRTPRTLAVLIIAVASLGISVALAADSGPRWQFGAAGNGPGLLGPHAAGIAVAPDGTAYVADAHDGRVERFAFGGAPAGGWGGLHDPSAVAVTPDGSVLVADASGVRTFSQAGDAGSKVSAADGITGIAATPAGLVLADSDDGVLRIVDAAGERVLATLPGVRDVALNAAGEILASANGRVHALELDGDQLRSWPAPGARGIAVAPDGDVLVATGTGHSVDVYDASGVRSGSITPGLNVVADVAADCRGNVYAIDNSNPRGHAFGDASLPAPPCPAPLAPTPAPKVEVLPVAVVPEPEPELGRTTRATALAGNVYVGKSRRKLTGRSIFPVGTEIDTSDGVVKLEFETTGAADRAKYGRLMSGEFSDGEFTFHQSTNDSLVELVLGDRAAAAARGKAVASAKKRRRVWSTARGRFRTTGSHGAATVRSTRWLTEERELGTFFRVREGQVEVKDLATGKKFLLGPGDEHLSKRPCLSQRRFRIRLRAPVGTTVRSAEVLVRGKRAPVERGSRLTALIDLRGVGKETVRVRITVRLTDGRILSGTRAYRTCRPERLPGGPPPEL